MLLALAALVLPGSLQATENVFTPERLGAAYEAYAHPDSLTIQSVYPAIRGEKVERAFGPLNLRYVGKKRIVNPRFRERLIDNYAHPYHVLEPNCVFHPDHHVTFTKGAHTVEAVSCFTCDELIVLADGKFLGRVSMGPPKILRTIYSASVPLSDTIRAAAEEWLTREFVDALSGSSMLTMAPVTWDLKLDRAQWPIQRSKIKERLIPQDPKMRLLDTLTYHCLNNRMALQFTQPDLATFQPKPVVFHVSDFTMVLHGSYNRAELFRNGKFQRTIDLFGIEDKLQNLIGPWLAAKDQ